VEEGGREEDEKDSSLGRGGRKRPLHDGEKWRRMRRGE